MTSTCSLFWPADFMRRPWELGNGRIARAEDEGAVRAVRAAMDEATAAAKAQK
jgi:hypothetical protein